MSEALDRPFHYPPLCRALTPDDHVVILVDEGILDRQALQRLVHEIDEEVRAATQEALRQEPSSSGCYRLPCSIDAISGRAAA